MSFNELSSTDVGNQNLWEVVVNLEDQYSIWPKGKKIPLGWENTGFEGTKASCLDYIKKTWTDMRPKSLREDLLAINFDISNF
jgi:MbtH protein